MATIAFRVDAATRIGIGHVMRCLTLANQLAQADHHIIFLCKLHQGNLIHLIKQQGFKVHELSAPKQPIDSIEDEHLWLGCSYQEDANECLQVLSHYSSIDLLVVDHYGIDQHWHTLMKKCCKKIMVIDDLANRKYHCELLLDQTLNRQPHNYQTLVPKNCQLMLGTHYILLRDEFAQARAKAQQKRLNIKHSNHILLSMGGSDPDNITEKIITYLIAVKEDYPQLQVTVVVSSSYPFLSALQKVTKQQWITTVVNPKSMAKLMLNADIAIGTSGTTAWERCCLGLPTITITSAANQQVIATNLEQAGAIINLGNYQQLNQEKLTFALKKLCDDTNYYLKMVKQSFACCDGLGAEKVVKQISISIGTQINSQVSLLPATLDDAKVIFTWQSNPIVRKYLRNNQPVQWQEHIDWLTKTLENPNVYLFLIKYNKISVGTLRLDKIKDLQWEISIIIDPNYQGKNIALKAIQQIPTFFKKAGVIAEVHQDNHASHKLFTAAGFTKFSSTLYGLKND